MAKQINRQLPAEVVQPARGRNIFLSFLSVVALVLLANVGAKIYLDNHTPNRGAWLVRQKWSLLGNLERPVDWLILGDSSCNQGVIPSVFNQRLNTTSINLCTMGNMTSMNSAWMLEAYIQRFGAPRNVVLVHVYDVWERRLTKPALAQIPDWNYDGQFNPPVSLSLKSQIQVLLEKNFPLYFANQSLSDVIRDPIETFNKSQSFQLEKDGFMVWDIPNPPFVEQQKQWHLESVKGRTFDMSTDNQRGLEHMIVLADKYDFDLYLANSPIYERLYQDKDFQAYYNQIREVLNSYSKHSQRMHYIMQSPVTFPKEKMENVDHVVYSAAQIYTNKLVEAIEAQPDYQRRSKSKGDKAAR